MNDKIFFDTKIFLYSFDKRFSPKMNISRKLLFDHPAQIRSVISFQVVQEFLNVCSKKGMLINRSKALFLFIENELYPRWTVSPTKELYQLTLDIKYRYQFSFYDSLIVASALESNCKILYTEDLQHGQQIDSLEILNPYVLT